MERWIGKIAVVTGASSGIGAVICKELVKKGVIVIGLARQSNKILELQNELIGASGKLYAYECDISKKISIKSTFNRIGKEFGAIHILINNAGVARGGLLLGDNALINDMVDVINTNFTGTLAFTRAGFELMTKTDDYGYIININSILGHSVPRVNVKPFLNVYPATKHAVIATNEIIRQELNFLKLNKIRISNISPGLVKTNIIQAAFEAVNTNSKLDTSTIFNNPSMLPEDVWDAILFVLSTPVHIQIQDIVLKPNGEKI